MGAFCLFTRNSWVQGLQRIKTMQFLLLTLAAVAGSAFGTSQIEARDNAVGSTRDSKMLSLFAVVNFPNDQCSTQTSGILGVCYSSSECNDKGGTADGNCAAGFGVCCKFIINGCGGTSSNNCTYLENEGYPTAITTASLTCTYTINAVSDDICQLRLDFDNFVLSVPNTGICSTNGIQMKVNSPTGHDPPTICGTNTGLHMYVETGKSATATTVVFSSGTGTSNRSWRVKVSQIECSNLARPPADCVQYFTGPGGEMRSFGYPGGAMITDVNYMSCIRQERGFCGINYRTNLAITSPDPYLVSDEASSSTGNAVTCPDGRVTIAHVIGTIGSTTATQRKFVNHCGTIFAFVEANTSPGTIYQFRPPFGITTSHRAATSNASSGYSLLYHQTSCL